MVAPTIWSVPSSDVHLDEALRLAVEDRSIDVGELLHEGLDADPALLRLGLREADVGDLGIGVGAGRDREGAGPGPPEEEGVLDHDARLEVGGVGELVA